MESVDSAKNRNRMPWLLPAVRRVSGSLPEWASVVLLFLALGVSVWSIEAAHWITPQPSLTLVLGLSLLGGWLLVKSRLPTWASYLLMVGLGLVVAVWQSAGSLSSAGGQPALGAWWRVVSAGQLNEGTVYFALFLSLVTWLVGFISAWFVLRRQNAWIAVLLGAITVLVNLSNLPRDYYYFLPLYLAVALLLIAQVNWIRHGGLPGPGTGLPYRGMAYAAGALLLVIVFVVTTAWVVPEPPLDQLGFRLSAGGTGGKDINESWFNIFAGVPAKWSLMESRDQETLLFKDPVERDNRIQFVITSASSGYWRTRRYDTYHAWGWTNSTTAEQRLGAGASVYTGEELSGGEVLVYTVENRLKTDVVLTGGQFTSASIPVLIETLPSGVPEATEIDRAEEDGIMTVASPWMLSPYQRYTVEARTTSVTPEELAQAGEDYPPDITRYYLGLPDTLPERTRQLGSGLTRGMATNYDKVVAIKGFLSRFKYNLEGEVAPEGTDGVDYFLFEAKEGVCTSFASAMAVMLRSVGIPARLCTGYLRGELDEDSGTLMVRSRDFHAWVEVYFPGYGWIEFDPTPGPGAAGEEEILGVGGSFSGISGGEEEFYLPPGSMPLGTSVRPRSRPKIWLYLVIISIPLFLVLAVRLALGHWLERLKKVQTAGEAYTRMCYLAALGKRGPVAQETPREYCARLALACPTYAEAIDNIARVYLEARYSPRKELEQTGQIRLQKSWVQLCPFLLRRALRFWKR